MNVKYHCKFCGLPGSAEIEDNYATMFCIEKWQKMLCCNHCGDYKVSKRKIEDSVKKGCMMLSQLRVVSPIEKIAEVEARLRNKLAVLLNRYSEIVCKHYHKMWDFDQSFVSEFMDQPDKWFAILGVYESGIRRQRAAHEHRTAISSSNKMLTK